MSQVDTSIPWNSFSPSICITFVPGKSYRIKSWWPSKICKQAPQRVHFTWEGKYWSIWKHLPAWNFQIKEKSSYKVSWAINRQRGVSWKTRSTHYSFLPMWELLSPCLKTRQRNRKGATFEYCSWHMRSYSRKTAGSKDYSQGLTTIWWSETRGCYWHWWKVWSERLEEYSSMK